MTDTGFQGSLTEVPIYDSLIAEDRDNDINKTMLFYQQEAIGKKIVNIQNSQVITSAFDARSHNVYSIYVNGQWENFFFVDFGIYMETDLERAFYLGPCNIVSCLVTDGSDPPKEVNRSYIKPILLNGHLWLQHQAWTGINFYRVSISGKKV